MTMHAAGMRSIHSDMNVTPMIDILLVLLIIFMVSVPAASKGEMAQAPQPARRDARPPENAMVLEIVKGSRGAASLTINWQSVSWQDPRARLETIYADRAQRVLLIKGDDRVGLLTPRAVRGLP